MLRIQVVVGQKRIEINTTKRQAGSRLDRNLCVFFLALNKAQVCYYPLQI